MKNNNKGFTLIELLAVIVILAVIALIATPLIMNVINNARENASKDAAYGYIDAVEKSMVEGLYANPDSTLPTTVTDSTISVKGTKPQNVNLTITSGAVTGGDITINGYSWSVDANGKLTKKAS